MDPLTAAALGAVVTTTVNFLVENLLKVIRDHPILIKGAEADFKSLLVEVKRLNNFLAENAQLKSNSIQWEQLVNDIRITLYKAEDIIDKILVKAKLNQESSKLKKLVKNKLGLLGKINEIENVKDILQDVKRIRDDHPEIFQTSRIVESPEEILPEKQGPSLEGNEVIGFDGEAEEVMKRLFEGSKDLEVVPVVGMAGLGKTTLARKIYNDPKILYEFFSQIWVYVGPSYKVKDIFLNILEGLKKRKEEFEDKDEQELAKAICDCVAQGGKCLIILDDVWKAEIINEVMKVFPENNKGHRIMMTTREVHVAESIYGTKPHNLKYLTPGESFELLERRVFGKRKCPIELKGYGVNIVERCSGVPLAIVVIAGALIGHWNAAHWHLVEQNVGKYLIERNNPKSCLKFVEMSYNNLPQEKKACFLYCGTFPSGFDIPAWKLIRLWIAEGLIKSDLSGTIEEIAEHFLTDIANRNLVIVTENKSNGQIKACRVHDMLHEFCNKEAAKEGLFQQVCSTNDQAIRSTEDPNTTARRLCIQSSISDDLISKDTVLEHVRSFLFLSSKQTQINNVELIPKTFPLIRVLDIESLKFGLEIEFNLLYHLRYIAMSGDFKALPASLSNFWNLQTIIINTSLPTLEIKADIWSMLQLRHVHTNKPVKLPAPTSTGKVSNIQTLSMVAPESCSEDVLARARNLKRFKIKGNMTAFLQTKKGGYKNFGVLEGLERLTLLNENMSEVLHLPPEFFGFLRKLRKLTFSNTRFNWIEADRLGQLECLEVLKLKENAFTGESWKTETGGFSKLQVLCIERADFESWEASNLPFPILKHLVLIDCHKLKAVPLDLADVPNFQQLTLKNTKEALKSAEEIKRMKDKNQTPESIKFKLTIPY